MWVANFTPPEMNTSTHWIWSQVGTGVGINFGEKRKNVLPLLGLGHKYLHFFKNFLYTTIVWNQKLKCNHNRYSVTWNICKFLVVYQRTRPQCVTSHDTSLHACWTIIMLHVAKVQELFDRKEGRSVLPWKWAVFNDVINSWCYRSPLFLRLHLETYYSEILTKWNKWHVLILSEK
jgi:hypothetical protein